MNTMLVFAGVSGAAALLVAGGVAGADGLALMRLAVCGAALGAAVATDLAERRIPNRLVLPAALACAILTLLAAEPISRLAAGLALVALLLAVSLSQPQALGMGDVKLALLLALGLDGSSGQALLIGLALAATFALLLLVLRGRSAMQAALPLAPFFASGALLALLT